MNNVNEQAWRTPVRMLFQGVVSDHYSQFIRKQRCGHTTATLPSNCRLQIVLTFTLDMQILASLVHILVASRKQGADFSLNTLTYLLPLQGCWVGCFNVFLPSHAVQFNQHTHSHIAVLSSTPPTPQLLNNCSTQQATI